MHKRVLKTIFEENQQTRECSIHVLNQRSDLMMIRMKSVRHNVLSSVPKFNLIFEISTLFISYRVPPVNKRVLKTLLEANQQARECSKHVLNQRSNFIMSPMKCRSSQCTK